MQHVFQTPSLSLVLLLCSTLSIPVLAQVDIKVEAKRPFSYYAFPLDHVETARLKAEIINLGNTVTGDIQLNFQENTEGLSLTKNVNGPFASADTTLAESDDFQPTRYGKHSYTCSATVTGDVNLSNNTSAIEYELSTDYYSYVNFSDTGVTTTIIEEKPAFIVGQTVKIFKKDTLDHVTVFLINPVAIAARYSVSVYKIDEQGKISFVAGGKIQNVPTNSNQFLDLKLSSTFNGVIDSGTYLFMIRTHTTHPMRLATSSENYQPGTIFYDATFGEYKPYDTIPEFRRNLFLKPVFRRPVSTGISLHDLELKSLVYPNPVIDILNISIPTSGEMEIRNALGQLLSTHQLHTGENTVPVDTLPTGTYLMEIKTDSGNFFKRVIK